MKTEQILQERGKTHGSFDNNASASQAIKQALEDTMNKSAVELSSVQAEALHMIAHKMARIVSGDPNEVDHWQDIAGYSQLVVKLLREPEVTEL